MTLEQIFKLLDNGFTHDEITAMMATPVQEPVQEPVQKPVQEPVQKPVEKPVEKPVQEPKQEPVQEQPQNPTTWADLEKRMVNLAAKLESALSVAQKRNLEDDTMEGGAGAPDVLTVMSAMADRPEEGGNK